MLLIDQLECYVLFVFLSILIGQIVNKQEVVNFLKFEESQLKSKEDMNYF